MTDRAAPGSRHSEFCSDIVTCTCDQREIYDNGYRAGVLDSAKVAGDTDAVCFGPGPVNDHQDDCHTRIEQAISALLEQPKEKP